jgi:hypothetical protein
MTGRTSISIARGFGSERDTGGAPGLLPDPLEQAAKIAPITKAAKAPTAVRTGAQSAGMARQ